MFDLLTTFMITNTTNIIALFILLVPIIIHLINPNKAKLLWIAHIQFIKTNDHKRVFQIKWLEKLILFIRLLMLISISLILAKPTCLSELTNVAEEHHYVSTDWLNNAPLDEQDKLNGLIETGDKLFFLEEANNKHYRSIKQMKLLVGKGDSGIKNHSATQSEYVAELTHRKTLPDVTHLYLTNRQNNYSNEIISSNSQNASYQNSYKIHLHNLIKNNNKTKINVEIISDKNSKTDADLLLIALNILSADSKIVLEIERRDSTVRPFKDDMPDIIFVLSETIEETKGHQISDVNSWIEVIPYSTGLIFKEKNNVDIQWEYSESIKLISILSEIINRFEKISTNNIISEDSILKNYFQNELALNTLSIEKIKKSSFYSKSLNSYLIFLFCLFLLLERWLVLRRDSHND